MVEEVVIDDRDLSETEKQPFVGKVIWSRYPCDCDICKNAPYGGDKWHIQIKPLDGVYTAVQHQWYRPSKTTKSGWGQMMKRLVKLGFRGLHPSDLEGKVFEWHWEKFKYPSGETAVWLPVREITGSELDIYEKAAERNAV